MKPSGLWHVIAAQAKPEGFCELSVILFTDLFLASVSQGPSAACTIRQLTSVPVSGGICIPTEAQPVSLVLSACLLLFHPAPIG